MTPPDPRQHVFRHRPTYRSEARLLARLHVPGARALDVGTAATGRSALLLASLGYEVVSIDMNPLAVQEFQASGAKEAIALAAADLTALPFASETFDVVLVAFHGMDYLTAGAARARALAEVQRVLRPGGSLVFNGYNPLGLVFSPDGLGNRRVRRFRAAYVLRGRFARPTLVDATGLELHQATPARTIHEVETATALRFRGLFDLLDRRHGFSRIALLSTAPYYLFTLP